MTEDECPTCHVRMEAVAEVIAERAHTEAELRHWRQSKGLELVDLWMHQHDKFERWPFTLLRDYVCYTMDRRIGASRREARKTSRRRKQ